MEEADEQLDGLRIRQLSALRRATYRSRSHAVIAAAVCAVTAVQCGVMAWQEWFSGVMSWFVGCVIAAGLMGTGAVYFIGRARRLHREAGTATIPSPAAPPDFSTLGDGSDVVDRLNRIE